MKKRLISLASKNKRPADRFTDIPDHGQKSIIHYPWQKRRFKAKADLNAKTTFCGAKLLCRQYAKVNPYDDFQV